MSSHCGRQTDVDLPLMMNTLYITDGVTDEHLRLVFHYEAHSSKSELLLWFSAPQIGSNTFAQKHKQILAEQY